MAAPVTCAAMGIKQCFNLANALPTTVEVIEAKATCYAQCQPNSTFVDPEIDSQEKWTQSCTDAVTATVYDDPDCTKENDKLTTQAEAHYKTFFDAKGKCVA